MSHPFSLLVTPLRYACQRDFAQLSNVRDLKGVVLGAVAAGKGAGVEPKWLDALSKEAAQVDAPSLPERKAALLRVVGHLHEAGVPLPPELSRLVGAPVTAADSGPLFARPSAAAPPAAQAPRPEPARLEEDDDGFSAAEPKKPAAKGRKKAVGLTESKSEARLLSIAPRSGPLATPLRGLPWRINPRLLTALEKKGVKRAGDVLFLLPRCYEDRRKLRTIAQLIPGERGVALGVVRSAGDVPVRGGRRQFRAVIADATGSISVTYFQSGPWLKAKFPIGKRLVVSGELRASYTGRDMAHPEVEPADDLESSSIHFNRIVPIYPGFERHEQRAFRELAFKICESYADSLEEPLPAGLRDRLDVPGLAAALRGLHFPPDTAEVSELDRHLSPAHRRLAFDELFFLQLGMALKRQGIKADPGIAFDVSEPRVEKAKAALPFQLTDAQGRSLKAIARDMGKAEPMNRLLQGDVGSGKTAVAMASAALALQDGYQVAIMAPTEILAEQHQRTFSRILGAMGYQVDLFTAGGSAKQRRDARAALAEGRTHLAVGTHALLQEGVQFHRLGLVVIDEQHRFGVLQRQNLMQKGVRPDVLVMTATPIPRTLAMTLYGDLEVSIIDELPPGRTPVKTQVFFEKQRPKVYEAMRAELDKGHQCYVVYPLVEESEKIDLADATQGAETIRQLFPQHTVGLLHGRMKAEEKEQVMQQFRAGKSQILVCTTVVEVGVDVPNASVMAIESAERFGLSQLHQLRGRVGRGAAVSFCFLLAGYAKSKEASDRLEVMARSSDGFVIAEKDLELRGPGEFLGTRQSGIPELAVANLARDVDLLELAQQEARAIVDSDPRLDLPEHRTLVSALEERWEGRLALAHVG